MSIHNMVLWRTLSGAMVSESAVNVYPVIKFQGPGM